MSEFASVALTRTELVALREMIDLTPVFEGRTEVRDAIREALRERRPSPLQVNKETLAAVARRIVPIDVPTSVLRSKMDRELERVRVRS